VANVSTTRDNFLEENNYVCVEIEQPLQYLAFTMGKFTSTKFGVIRIHDSIKF
jgi:hypothetical protein